MAIQRFGGIEAGGTKFVCAVGSATGDIDARLEIETQTPAETIQQVAEFFRNQPPLSTIGIASFGPIDLRPESPAFGSITTTPKLAWRNFNIVNAVREATGIERLGFDTDVNGAALGEHRWGAARGLDNFIYLTVGTGIGGGGMINGRMLHGASHPEMGHIRIPHDRARDPFLGCCPSHGDCLEGLASGEAIRQRWGCGGESLPTDHPAWPLETEYLAIAIANFVVTLSPERIILGGSVMHRIDWMKLRSEVLRVLAGYVAIPQIVDHINEFLVPPGLGTDSGVLGALALAASVL